MELLLTIPIIILSLTGVVLSSLYIYEKINEDKKIPFK